MKIFNTYNLGTDENGNIILINNMDQHMFVAGGSGSGKSVYLFSLYRQTMEKGGGLINIDGKGDISMYMEFIQHAIDTGRLNDVMVLNFSKEKNSGSNSFSIFETLDLKDINTLMESINIGEAKDFFGKQSKNVLDSIFGILNFLKESGVRINFDTYFEVLDINSMIVNLLDADKNNPNKPDEKQIKFNSLQKYKKFWVPKNVEIAGQNVSENICAVINSYGCIINKTEEQAKENKFKPVPNEQLIQQISGYSAMTLKSVKPLISTFNNIFNNAKNDINFSDIISQNRLCWIILPTMKLSQDDPHNIAAFILESIKNAIGVSLGNEIEIDENDVFKMFEKNQVTASPQFLLGLDELAAFFRKSMSSIGSIVAQARSVKISCILSTQDTASLEDGDGANWVKKILGSCFTQVFLKTQDNSTLNHLDNIIIELQKEVDEDGKEINNNFKEKMKNYVKTAKNGIGLVKNVKFGKFLSPYKQPKSKFKFKVKK